VVDAFSGAGLHQLNDVAKRALELATQKKTAKARLFDKI
jgi:hypothetical protein